MGKKISGPGDQDTSDASVILHGLDKEESVPEFVQRLEPVEGPDLTEKLGKEAGRPVRLHACQKTVRLTVCFCVYPAVGETAKEDVLRNVEEAFQANKKRVRFCANFT